MSAGTLMAGLVATAGGGIALYDFLKSRGYNTEDVAKLIAENPVDAKAYLKKIRPDVKAVTDKKSLRRLGKVLKEEHGPLAAAVTLAHFENAIEQGNNAFAYPGKKDYYVISSKKVNPLVIDHELGHVDDFSELKGKGKDPMTEYGMNSLLRGYGQMLFKSIYDKDVIRRETNAWDRVKTKGTDRDNIEEAALGSYHKAFHKNRGTLAGAVSGGVIGDMIGTAVAPKRKQLFTIGGSIIGALPGMLV